MEEPMSSYDARLRLNGESGLPLGVEVDLTDGAGDGATPEGAAGSEGPALEADTPAADTPAADVPATDSEGTA